MMDLHLCSYRTVSSPERSRARRSTEPFAQIDVQAVGHTLSGNGRER